MNYHECLKRMWISFKKTLLNKYCTVHKYIPKPKLNYHLLMKPELSLSQEVVPITTDFRQRSYEITSWDIQEDFFTHLSW